MRITDVLEAGCVKVPVKAVDKRDAIFELVDLLAERSGLAAAGLGEELREAVWERETTRTTGIGHGIGIPHGKTDGIDRPWMAIGRVGTPLEFGAIDGKPVELIILLVSPEDQTRPHMEALARISRLLTDEPFRNQLKKASDAAALFGLIDVRESES